MSAALAMRPPPPLPAMLARWRAGQAALSDKVAHILFGVGLATLQRIERGEIEPEPELAARIADIVSPSSARAPVCPPRAVPDEAAAPVHGLPPAPAVAAATDTYRLGPCASAYADPAYAET